MKRLFAFFLCCLLLTGCGRKSIPEASFPATTGPDTESSPVTAITEPAATGAAPEIPYHSRFDAETIITLSDDGILVDTLDSGADEDAVAVTHDIIYYEDREAYDSGNPYGEGTPKERHTAEEAAAHTVVNITQPGAYRINGKLSAGQIRVDLGENAYEDENAVVELILQNADITCTVAPAILFLNTYECDGNWSAEEAKPDVDTSAAGANLILEGNNIVSGSHVAKIYKDKDGEKKLWKQDGAIYSYMSMNVFGPGSLELTADNEGLDTELHLTINGGNLTIRSDNDGINTNEDGVSVTTINGGSVRIAAGLGAEGDGIDSNGYLVINGGTVISAANPAADAGLDSDLGSYIHGGTVIAMGSAMDWAESDSNQVTMNLQFAQQQKAGSKITITTTEGTESICFDTAGTHARNFTGLILSHPGFVQGATYHVYVDDLQQQYTGTDVSQFGPGGMMPPEGFGEGNFPAPPDGMPFPQDSFGGGPGKGGQVPDGEMPQGPDGMTPPGGFGGMVPPEGFEGPEFPSGQGPQNFDGQAPGEEPAATPRIQFYMNDKVNAFSGVETIRE